MRRHPPARARGRLLVCGAAIATAATTAMTAACGDPCTNRERQRVRSPGGEWEAVVFVRDCGPKSGTSVQLGIVPRGQPVVGQGNAFAAERDPQLAVRWTGAATLRVRYRQAGEVSWREQVGDVRVVLDTTSDTTGDTTGNAGPVRP